MPSGRPVQGAWSVELWLRPSSADQSGVILAFYDPRRPRGMLLRQWKRFFLVEKRLWSRELDDGTPEFGVEGVFLDPRFRA